MCMQRYRLINFFSQLRVNPSYLFYFRIYSEAEYFVQPCQFCPYCDQATGRTPRNPSSILAKRSASCPKGQDCSWVPHSLLLYGYRRQASNLLVKQTNHLSLQSRLRMNGAVRAFPRMPSRITHGQFQSMLL
jgi:hypothetical protein